MSKNQDVVAMFTRLKKSMPVKRRFITRNVAHASHANKGWNPPLYAMDQTRRFIVKIVMPESLVVLALEVLWRQHGWMNRRRLP